MLASNFNCKVNSETSARTANAHFKRRNKRARKLCINESRFEKLATPLEEWVEEQARLAQPDRIYWCDGSEEEAHRLIEIGLKEEKICDRPVFHKLNHKLWPNAYLHRSHPTDVARTEHLTFVCHPSREDAGPNNNWMEPKEAKELLTNLTKGCMKGRTMYVLPYMFCHT